MLRNVILRVCLRCARSFQVASQLKTTASYRAALSHCRYNGVIRKLQLFTTPISLSLFRSRSRNIARDKDVDGGLNLSEALHRHDNCARVAKSVTKRSNYTWEMTSNVGRPGETRLNRLGPRALPRAPLYLETKRSRSLLLRNLGAFPDPRSFPARVPSPSRSP